MSDHIYPQSFASHMDYRTRLCLVLINGQIKTNPFADVYIKPQVYNIPEPILRAPLIEPIFTEGYLTLKVLPSHDIRTGAMVSFFDRIRRIHHPIIFGITAEGKAIFFQLSFSQADKELIEQQLQIYFPTFATVPHYFIPPRLVRWSNASEFQLQKPLYIQAANPQYGNRLLKPAKAFTFDSYHQLLPLLASLGVDDWSSFQITCFPLNFDFVQTILRYLKRQRQDFSPTDIYLLNKSANRTLAIESKVPPWIVCVRIISSSQKIFARFRENFLSLYETTAQSWKVSGIFTTSTLIRSIEPWNVFNTEELAELAHFPGTEITAMLETASLKATAPPSLYTGTGLKIGLAGTQAKPASVIIPVAVRDRHLYVVGKSGTGKSTLLYNCIRQDIEQGFGVAVIDPHGDLVDDVLHSIPEHRIRDTIYLNAKDTQHPIGLNILNAKSEDEIGILADDLLITFKRLSESWGERMENILRYSFHSLLRCPGTTLLDLKPLLQRSDFRERVIASLQHPALADFWQYEFPNYPKDASAPILNRLSKFALSPVLSGIIGQAEGCLNFFEVIQSKKILLVKIAKGEIGEDTAHLLGSLLVSQLQLAIMRRAALSKEARAPYFLYVDEFQTSLHPLLKRFYLKPESTSCV